VEFKFITSRNENRELLSELISADEIGLDVETTSLDLFLSDLLLIQIEANNKIFVIDVKNVGKDFVKYIVSLIIDSNKLCIGHNIKFDIQILHTYTGELISNVFDTMVSETLMYQGIGKQFYSLKELVDKYYGVELDKSERDGFVNNPDVFSQNQLIYAALDVKFLRGIKEKQTEILINQGQGEVLELEKRFEAPVASMELNGVLIDKDCWRQLEQDATNKKAELESKIKESIVSRLNLNKANLYELAMEYKIPVTTKRLRTQLESITDVNTYPGFLYENLNINSHSQMLKVLVSLGVPVTSTGEDVIKDFKGSDESIKLLLDYREQEKRRSTYGENFLKDIHPKTGRFHTEFHQVGTATGRLSASRLHQVPRNADYRRSFVAREDFLIMAADYSQQEYRLAGSISGEPRIIEAYQAGKDMHTATASIIYNKGMDNISKDERDFGKTVNFATLYGSTEWGLARNLGIELDEGRRLLDIFWKGYPTLKAFKDEAEKQIWKHKYSVTPLGRKRYFENRTLFVDDKDYYKYMKRVQREGFNHIIQGCGADIIKIAMCNIYYENPYKDMLYFYLQAHDEVVSEIWQGHKDFYAKFVVDCMLKAEQPFLEDIPAKVDYNIGKSWTKG